MADETVSTGTETGGEAAGDSQVTAAPKPESGAEVKVEAKAETKPKGKSFEELMEKAAGKVEVKADSEETPEDIVEGEEAKSTGPKKLSAKDRIQELTGKAKTFEEKSTALESENAALKQQLAEVQQGKQTAPDQKEKVLGEADYAKIRADLEDMSWPEDTIDVYITSIKENQALKQQINGVVEWKEHREAEESEKEQAAFKEKHHSDYKDVAKNYPDYFQPADNGGLPKLKPEYAEDAEKILKRFDIYLKDKDGKDYFYDNPLLSSREGLEMFMRELSAKERANKEAKGKVDKINTLKSTKILSPDTTGTPAAPKKHKGFEHYLKQAGYPG